MRTQAVVAILGLGAACSPHDPVAHHAREDGPVVQDTGTATPLPDLPDRPPTAMCEVPGRSGPFDLAMFDLLTARRWGDPIAASPDPNFAHGYALDLHANGTYRWTSHGVTGDRNDTGVWDFRASSATSGLLLLDGRSALPFVIEDEGLCMLADSTYALAPDSPHRGETGRRRDLPELGPPATWCLASAEAYAPRTPWLDRPDEVRMDWMGNATVQTEGESIDGVMSMYSASEDERRLAQGWQVGRLRCQKPGRPDLVVQTYDSTPEAGGEWLFNHRFDPVASNPVQDLPDVRHGGVELRGRLLGKLFQGGSVKIGAAVTTDMDRDVEGVYVTAQALKGADLAPAGPVYTVWRQDVGYYHLNPYTWLGFRTALRLPKADGVQFTLVVDDEPWWQESVRLDSP